VPSLKNCLLFLLSVCLCLTLWSRTSYAVITLDDQFIAGEACEALQSIRRETNPGNIRLTPQQRVFRILYDNVTYYTFLEYAAIINTNTKLRWSCS